MARSEARIHVAIWDDDDFLALPAAAQRLYLFLISQRDVAHTGLLALRERRWAQSSRGLTPDGIREALLELSAERFVIFDEDRGELLIRAFMRRDEVYRQPNLLRAAEKQLSLVTSPLLRAALAAELRRILAAQDIPKSSVEVVDRMLEAIGNPSPNPSPMASPNPSDTPLGDRGVVTVVTTGIPLTPSSSPLAPGPPPSAASRTPARATNAARLIVEAVGATNPEAEAIVERIVAERSPRNLVGLLRRMATDGDLAELVDQHRAQATKTELAAAIARAREGPPCEHGEPGGANLHPASRKPLCPLCRTANRFPAAEGATA